MEVAIALGALVAALVPLWATWVTVHKRTEGDYTRSLEQRLRDTEARLSVAQKEAEALAATIAELRGENLDLLRRLMRANGGTK